MPHIVPLRIDEGRRDRYLRTLLLVWGVVVFAISLLGPGATDDRFNGVPIAASLSEAQIAWGWSDPGSYSRMGESIADTGTVTDELRWTLMLWPPGMGVIYAFVISMARIFSGEARGFIFLLALFNFAIWQVALLALRRHLLPLRPEWEVVFALALVQLLPVWRFYVLGRGVLYSDGITAALLVIAMSLVLRFSGNRPLARSELLLAAVLLATAAYIRGQYSLVSVLLLLASAVALLVAGLRVLRSRICVRQDSHASNPVTTNLLILTILMTLVMGPFWLWRHVADEGANNPEWSTGGWPTWTPNDAFVYEANWMQQDQLAGFIAQGGQGTACIIDPKICREIHDEAESMGGFNIYLGVPYPSTEYRAFVFSSIINSPIKWILIKLPIYAEFFSSAPSISGPASPSTLLLIVRIVGFLAVGLHILRSNTFLGQLLFSLIIFATIGPPFVAHLEVRYLLLPAFLGELTVLLMTVTFISIGSTWVRSALSSKVH